jgi:hypothetical protein
VDTPGGVVAVTAVTVVGVAMALVVVMEINTEVEAAWGEAAS